MSDSQRLSCCVCRSGGPDVEDTPLNFSVRPMCNEDYRAWKASGEYKRAAERVAPEWSARAFQDFLTRRQAELRAHAAQAVQR